MNIEEFDYDLPKELIAQTPLEDRSSSRLLVLNKNNIHYLSNYKFKRHLTLIF